MKTVLLSLLLCASAHAAPLTSFIETPTSGSSFLNCHVQQATQSYLVLACDRHVNNPHTVVSGPATAKYDAVFVFLPDDYYAFTAGCFLIGQPHKSYDLVCEDP